MTEYKGKSVCNGIAIGKLHVINKHILQADRHSVSDVNKELSRFKSAKSEAESQLAGLYDKALHELGEKNAAIFEIHRMMLDDEDYIDSITSVISEQNVNAEYAVSVTADNFSALFDSMEDEYMRERAADVKDISERLIRILNNSDSQSPILDEPSVVLANELTPSEIMRLDKKLVLAFVMIRGSANSHTAILARGMGIPSVCGIDIDISDELDGQTAIIDGTSGVVYINPDTSTIAEIKKRQSIELKNQRFLQHLKGKPSITKDGKVIHVYANISNINEMEQVINNDAEGIGLFRSEFLYLERNSYPTEDEQFLIYKRAAEAMAGKPVIIRTIDIGADKQADYFNLDKEVNPAMGMRGVRFCLTRPELFKTQLRAIYRASEYGRIAVMYPMITSLEEIKQIKKISSEVKSELDNGGVPYRNIKEGIMIETPAAAMISDILAKEVDFFSIGTNDLSQYTMAIDRQNSGLDKFFNPRHGAVLRMIEMTCKNAHEENIWVGICGELGSDFELTERFLKMGIDEISVSPPYVLPLRDKIINIDLRK